MPLHLVGETLDKARGSRLAAAGKLIQLMRGIYVDADDDADALVLKHAIRIAKYLYKNAYLSGATATLLAPTRDGRLFLSARRNQRTRIRALEIIQNEAPKQPSLNEAIIDDGMGEFRTPISSIRQRFLEAFRVRSEHAASIDPEMRAAVAQRLIEEYGSPKGAADAIWSLARENEWYREGESAERYLLKQPTTVVVKNEATLDLTVGWHARSIGHLTHDGFEWRWKPADRHGPTLFRQTTPGLLPPFIVSLLPEGWLEHVLHDMDERALLKSGKRYISNITIVDNETELPTLPHDVLLARLQAYTSGGVFTGRYIGPKRADIETSFEKNLAQIYARADTPRLSGVQIKAPMCLDIEGTFSASTGKPFTHILKPAGTSGYDALPLVEWTAMTLGRAVGLATPSVALVAMPDNMPPALIVERFDIREGLEDTRMIALEDLCSVLNLPTRAKYSESMESVGRAVRALSTDPTSDLLTLIRRVLFAWLIGDGDLHLKNLALLKSAELGDAQFRSVRVAPLYDAVTTRLFPNLKHDRMALKLNGKDDNLRRADFRVLGANWDLTAAAVDAVIDETLSLMHTGIAQFTLPSDIELSIEMKRMIEGVMETCRMRIQRMSD